MPGRILVVDDVPTSRLLTRTRLTMAYFDVIEAASGPEAISLARAEEPDLILLDVVMPGLDGFETCRRLKADPASAHIPVVILTALDGRADRVRGLEAGADDFLTKPFEDAALLARVNSLLRMKMVVDELRLRTIQGHGAGLPATVDPPGFATARILLIGASPALAAEIAAQVRHQLGPEIETSDGLADARPRLSQCAFDAFILGPEPSDGEPMRIASFLRSRPTTRQAALMMLLRPDEAPRVPLAMDMGVSDYVMLPLDYAEMAARLRVQLRRKHYADRLRESVETSMEMALTDPLTGLSNRRHANARLVEMIDRAEREGTALAAMMLDLDDFKQVNDAHGHLAGDAVLAEFARRLAGNVRSHDLVARVGGEEFLVVMPDIQPEAAARVAERVRHSVETPAFCARPGCNAGAEIALTVSIGLALRHEGEGASDLIERADRALYDSKAAGRNVVTMAAA